MNSSISSASSEPCHAETVASSLIEQINVEDIRNMVSVQRDMLSRFEKTNEMLINFNILSGNRFAVTSQVFKRHTTLMYDMKKDLDVIFKRIRVLKQRLGKMYPDAFKACNDVYTILDTDEELSSPSSIPESITSVQSVRAISESNTSTTEQETERAESSASGSVQGHTKSAES